ncbi:anaphase-promoting complex subunit Cut9 [Paramarasmius palmivorus]|uniref:Anaphase-promoting complex subunit Cut9 n=1 Tax=Paramarasmius palmivorus TaxID=297713 RepID=A0AAW0DYQ2_9AGAR
MTSTPPPTGHFAIPAIPNLPTPSGSRHRGSIGSSFSFGPQSLVDSFNDANSSTYSHNYSVAMDPNRSMGYINPPQSSPRRPRKRKESIGRPVHPLANDTTGIFQDSEDDADDEEEGEWTSVRYSCILGRQTRKLDKQVSRLFTHEHAINGGLDDPNDAFWLAQTYFMQHQYSRAERLLTRPFPISPPRQPPSPALNMTNGDISHLPSFKGKGREQEPEPITRIPLNPSGVLGVSDEMQDHVARLVDMSLACRYLAAQCQLRQGDWTGATEMLGEANPFRGSARSGPAIPNIDGGIKIEASMCHLRGLLMLKLNKADQAKHCFMEALALDVKCYDAFEQLVSGEMLSPDEEWEFVQGLSYASQTPQDATFIQLIYTTRLRKYKHGEEQALTRRRLVEEYGLGDNPDVLYSFADALYTNFRWSDCFVITSRILNLVNIHNPTVPLHLACMYHLKHLHSKLFLLAHEMVDREPENPISWYAVGVWYLSHKNFVSARQYFSKSSLMDPRFAPAWIAFGHTFANEGEHDHAVTAYSTAARMFPGSHIPLTFVGMEQIVLSNYKLADEALAAAHSMCDSDPLLYNERGVMAYNHGRYNDAAELFEKALSLAEITQSSQHSWTITYVNLGTCYRRLRRYDEARDTYKKVIALDPRQSLALGFLGLVYHLTGNVESAIVKYHEALSVDPINAYIMELLNIALESAAALALHDVGSRSKEQFKIQAGRLKEKYATIQPAAKELFDQPGLLLAASSPRDVSVDSVAGDSTMGEEMSVG